MKKNLFIFVFIITVLISAVPLHTQNHATDRIIDNAGLLTTDEKTRLEMLIEELAYTYNFELIILTMESIDGEDPIDYSWNLLESIDLDGETWDGCLLLQSVGERDFAITVSGRGEGILNDAAYNKLENDLISYLRKDDYSGAYEAFIRDWEQFLTLESKGKGQGYIPETSNQSYNFLHDSSTHGICLAAAWILSLIIGLLAVFNMKRKMNTVLSKKEADTYIIPGSLALTRQYDNFLYSTITKIRRQSSSSSSRGGSSRSGGGRSSRSFKY
jgi:uncharacterized protein